MNLNNTRNLKQTTTGQYVTRKKAHCSFENTVKHDSKNENLFTHPSIKLPQHDIAEPLIILLNLSFSLKTIGKK